VSAARRQAAAGAAEGRAGARGGAQPRCALGRSWCCLCGGGGGAAAGFCPRAAAHSITPPCLGASADAFTCCLPACSPACCLLVACREEGRCEGQEEDLLRSQCPLQVQPQHVHIPPACSAPCCTLQCRRRCWCVSFCFINCHAPPWHAPLCHTPPCRATNQCIDVALCFVVFPGRQRRTLSSSSPSAAQWWMSCGGSMQRVRAAQAAPAQLADRRPECQRAVCMLQVEPASSTPLHPHPGFCFTCVTLYCRVLPTTPCRQAERLLPRAV
jgi:hypothetical protein